jgi:hypothetical protein
VEAAPIRFRHSSNPTQGFKPAVQLSTTGDSFLSMARRNELVLIIGDAEHNCPTAGRCSLFLISRVRGFPRGAMWNHHRFFLDESS